MKRVVSNATPIVLLCYVLKAAKERRPIQQITPIVNDMIQAGRWYSARVIQGFLRDVGETP